jgi:hypothetical protein
MNEAVDVPELGIGQSLRAGALYQLDVAGRMLGRGGVELHAGVHEARKAIRRVRATLRLARRELGPGAQAASHELGTLGRSLSAIRDAGSVVETVEVLLGKAGRKADRAMLRRLCRALTARRAAALASLLGDDPALVQRRAALRRLRDDIAALPWDAVSALQVGNEIARSERRARRSARRARDSRNADRRHRWRRHLRRLRYQLRIVEGELGWLLSTRGTWSWPDPTGNATSIVVSVKPKTLRTIADRLGYEHDLHVLDALLPELKEIGPLDRRAARKRVRKAIAAALDR